MTRHEHTAEPICPWCDHEQSHAWEFGDGDEGEFEIDCGMCGKVMFMSRHIAVSYSTEANEAGQRRREAQHEQRLAIESRSVGPPPDEHKPPPPPVVMVDD